MEDTVTRQSAIQSVKNQILDARRTGDVVDLRELEARLAELEACTDFQFCEVCGDTRGLVDDVPGMWPHCPGCMTV